MTQDTLRRLRGRAFGCCEYCRLSAATHPLPFQIDHIIAKQHGGSDDFNNLAFACMHCNRHKGPNIAGLDPETSVLTPLFHPRNDLWEEHFRWSGAEIIPLTPIGRVTVLVLFMNDPQVIWMRSALLGSME